MKVRLASPLDRIVATKDLMNAALMLIDLPLPDVLPMDERLANKIDLARANILNNWKFLNEIINDCQ